MSERNRARLSIYTGVRRTTVDFPGDRIWVDKQRFGFMTATRFVDGDTLWMLATGTRRSPPLKNARR